MMALNKDSIDLVIYHGFCQDGFSSAFTAWLYLGGINVEYYGAKHGNPPPDVKGRNVLICDFSYNYATVCDMIKETNSLLIIDHHKTAEKELENIPDEYKIFDMDHSGAYLTWRYFYPNNHVPKFILYVEDKDLWKFKHEETMPFTQYLNCVEQNFYNYRKLLRDDVVASFTNKGKTLLMSLKQDLDMLTRSAGMRREKLADGNIYNIIYVNSSIHKSELGNHLLSIYQGADFSAVYQYLEEKNITAFSLRSEDKRTDVAYIAKLYGGGGHRNASGLSLEGFNNSLTS